MFTSSKKASLGSFHGHGLDTQTRAARICRMEELLGVLGSLQRSSVNLRAVDQKLFQSSVLRHLNVLQEQKQMLEEKDGPPSASPDLEAMARPSDSLPGLMTPGSQSVNLPSTSAPQIPPVNEMQRHGQNQIPRIGVFPGIPPPQLGLTNLTPTPQSLPPPITPTSFPSCRQNPSGAIPMALQVHQQRHITMLQQNVNRKSTQCLDYASSRLGQSLVMTAPRKPLPAQMVPQPLPAQMVPQPLPAQMVPQPLPAQMVPQPLPAQMVPQPLSAQMVPQPLPAQMIPQPLSAQMVPQPLSAQMVPQPLPPQMVPQPLPAQMIPQPLSAQMVPQPLPAQMIPQPLSAQMVPQPLPAQMVPQPVPAQMVSQQLPAQMVLQPLPAQMVDIERNPYISSTPMAIQERLLATILGLAPTLPGIESNAREVIKMLVNTWGRWNVLRLLESPQALKQQTELALNALHVNKGSSDAMYKGQKQMLGERLYSAIQGMPAPPPGMVNNIGKITGMLLELDNSKVLEIIESSQDLREKAEEALVVLRAHGKNKEEDVEPSPSTNTTPKKSSETLIPSTVSLSLDELNNPETEEVKDILGEKLLSKIPRMSSPPPVDTENSAELADELLKPDRSQLVDLVSSKDTLKFKLHEAADEERASSLKTEDDTERPENTERDTPETKSSSPPTDGVLSESSSTTSISPALSTEEPEQKQRQQSAHLAPISGIPPVLPRAYPMGQRVLTFPPPAVPVQTLPFPQMPPVFRAPSGTLEQKGKLRERLCVSIQSLTPSLPRIEGNVGDLTRMLLETWNFWTLLDLLQSRDKLAHQVQLALEALLAHKASDKPKVDHVIETTDADGRENDKDKQAEHMLGTKKVADSDSDKDDQQDRRQKMESNGSSEDEPLSPNANDLKESSTGIPTSQSVDLSLESDHPNFPTVKTSNDEQNEIKREGLSPPKPVPVDLTDHPDVTRQTSSLPLASPGTNLVSKATKGQQQTTQVVYKMFPPATGMFPATAHRAIPIGPSFLYPPPQAVPMQMAQVPRHASPVFTAPPITSEQRERLRESLLASIQKLGPSCPQLDGNVSEVTKMLLDSWNTWALLDLLQSPEKLRQQVQLALGALLFRKEKTGPKDEEIIDAAKVKGRESNQNKQIEEMFEKMKVHDKEGDEADECKILIVDPAYSAGEILDGMKAQDHITGEIGKDQIMMENCSTKNKTCHPATGSTGVSKEISSPSLDTQSSSLSPEPDLHDSPTTTASNPERKQITSGGDFSLSFPASVLISSALPPQTLPSPSTVTLAAPGSFSIAPPDVEQKTNEILPSIPGVLPYLPNAVFMTRPPLHYYHPQVAPMEFVPMPQVAPTVTAPQVSVEQRERLRLRESLLASIQKLAPSLPGIEGNEGDLTKLLIEDRLDFWALLDLLHTPEKLLHQIQLALRTLQLHKEEHTSEDDELSDTTEGNSTDDGENEQAEDAPEAARSSVNDNDKEEEVGKMTETTVKEDRDDDTD